MTINCSLCGLRLVSVLIPSEDALKELTKKLIEHCIKSHGVEWQKLAAQVMLLQAMVGWYLSFTTLALIPECDEWLNDEVDKNQDRIMNLLGFDVEGENGEEPPGEGSGVVSILDGEVSINDEVVEVPTTGGRQD